MEETLLRKLIEKNHFIQGTEVDASYHAVDISGQAKHPFGGTFTVVRLLENRNTGKIVLDLSSVRDGTRIKANAEDVTGIDGMTPLRFAENYLIAPDGTDIKITGKRRGRRPKGWVDPDA